ncbi:MAG: DUF1801 domain-containing protein [Ilumatobacteraceae bacterium]
MTKSRTNPTVDAYTINLKKWQEETKKLRRILLDCQLTEELKWSKPCYAYQKNNVVIIQGFKEYCALLFFKGVLLNDPKGILKKTGVNTRVGRQIRFTNVKEIIKMEPILKSYIYQAIKVEKDGLKVSPPKKSELILPEEFRSKLRKDSAMKAAFEELTPGRQRAYGFYFSAPKQSKTRESRIEKVRKQILSGKGLDGR